MSISTHQLGFRKRVFSPSIGTTVKESEHQLFNGFVKCKDILMQEEIRIYNPDHGTIWAIFWGATLIFNTFNKVFKQVSVHLCSASVCEWRLSQENKSTISVNSPWNILHLTLQVRVINKTNSFRNQGLDWKDKKKVFKVLKR